MRRTASVLLVAVVVGATVGYVVFGPSASGTPESAVPAAASGPVADATAGSLDPAAHERTVSLVRETQRPAGGFDRLRPASPSVYSTHHFLRVVDAADLQVVNRSGTVAWLQAVLADRFRGLGSTAALSNRSHVAVRDYYDAVAALSRLDAAPANRTATVRDIQRFEAADGSYCFARPRNGSCAGDGSRLVGTRVAVAALHELGYTETHSMNDTREWLLDRWRDDATFEGQGALSRAGGIAVSLDRLGANVTALPAYERRQSWIRDRRADVARSLAADRVPLLRVENYVQLRELFGLHNGTFQEQYRGRLVDAQLPDGGYHVAGSGYSEPSGTAVAVELLRDDGGLPGGFDREALAGFVRHYDLPSGGFAPVVRPRPTVTRSYHALAVLDRFGAEPADAGSLADWLADEPRVGGSGVAATYRYAALAARFDVDGPSRERAERAVGTVLDADNASMEQLHYAVRLAAVANVSVPDETVLTAVRDVRNEDGSYGAPATTTATYHAVATLDALDASPAAPNRTVRWLRQARADGGGYFMRRADERAPRPDVYATSLTVRALSVLDAEPRRPAETRRWLRSMESRDGGFYVYRSSGEPTLEYTYWAVVALDALADDPTAASVAPADAAVAAPG